MKKKMIAAALSAGLALGMISTAFAGAWQANSRGWWYLNDDGTYPVSGWQWIDGNGDGIAECYYFDQDGYMVQNTVVGGYTVNADGQWVDGGTVQTEKAQMAAYAEICRKYEAQYGKTDVAVERLEYTDEPEKTLTGVSFLGLYDLDGNGTEEFLIGYTTPNPQEYSFCKYIFSVDVYTWNGAEAVLCGKIKDAELWTGGESDCGIRLMSRDGKIYITAGSQGTGAGSVYHFYGIGSGNSLEELLSYEIMEEIRINGQKTDQNYETLWDGWTTLGHYDVHGIEADWAEDFNINASLENISAVKAKLGL